MADPSPYSVNNTQVERLHAEASVLKRFRPNVAMPLDALAGMMAAYLGALRDAGVSTPRVMSTTIGDGVIEYVVEDAGPNLLEVFPRVGDLLADRVALAEVARIFATAQESGVSLDPHPKNFAVDGAGNVRYVDFTPPLVPAYVIQRVSLESAGDARLLLANFDVFGPAYLGYHFIADIGAHGGATTAECEQIAALFAEAGVIGRGLHLVPGMRSAIRGIEDERLRRGLYLY